MFVCTSVPIIGRTPRDSILSVLLREPDTTLIFQFQNGDRTPISPLWPIGHGLSFTTFEISSPTVTPSNVSVSTAPPAANDAAHAKFVVGVTATNTGNRDGPVTIFVTYYKQTDGVVRWARMLCGFTKVLLAAGSSARTTVEVQVADLARWSPSALGTDLLGQQVSGAYVVDGGVHQLQVDQCIDSGVSYGETARTCTPLELAVNIGEDGRTYVAL